ncbi:hypothetical protein J0B02_11015 [Enterobacteriaceae bacterium YMB-R22]|nr:hypothetical protein [Tenebrionicola larvae]
MTTSSLRRMSHTIIFRATLIVRSQRLTSMVICRRWFGTGFNGISRIVFILPIP